MSTLAAKPMEGSERGRASTRLHPATYAVIVAFCLRAVLLVASQHANDRHTLALPTVGSEAQFIAWSLASGKGFAHPFTGYDMPTAWLAPVYPAILSLGFRIFPMNITDGGVYVGQFMNAAFSAFTCWPIWWLGVRLGGQRMGLAAAWAWVVMPFAILLPIEWVWDQSVAALILALLLCATYQVRTAAPTSTAWMGYGCLWGFAALVNPTLCVLLPLLLVWIAAGRLRAGLAIWAPLGKCVLLFALCLLPWTLRNYFVVDGLIFVKSNFGLELWLGNNDQVPADDVYSPKLHPLANLRELLPLVFEGEPKYSREKLQRAIEFIKANPGTFAKLVKRRFVDTWTASNDANHDPWIQLQRRGRTAVWLCTLLSVIALTGLFFALWKNADRAMPMVLPAVIFPIPYYITHSSLRYRHPIDPVLTILAVYAVSAVWPAFRHDVSAAIPDASVRATPAL